VIWLHIIRLALGVLVLYVGAVALVRGSATLARAFGVRPLVIGLTVIAYGTSAPELAVSSQAAIEHAQSIALGNVIGSCAANISLILGISALITPQTVERRVIRREIPILLASAIAIPLCLIDGRISRIEGILLIACAVLFTIATLTFSAGDDAADAAPDAPPTPGPRPSRLWGIVLAAAGLALIVAGSGVFLHGARGIAAKSGLSERLLGLTVIAIGTSLPELIASVIAASRKHAGLVVGSVIGSNLLNVFLVLGVVAYLRPIEATVHPVDLIGLLAITLLGAIMLRGSRRITRIEGAILVAAYVGFVTATVLL
jgi:cation:H+ antiporter